MSDPKGERIAKIMARAGLCSRREAEDWIRAGRVRVNEAVLSELGYRIGAEDRILVDGKPLPLAERTRLWRYHKPKGVLTTRRDPEGRPTLFDRLAPDLPRVIAIGRLDFNSEGLLLLTNDGALARRLELPATGWIRRYRVRVKGRIEPTALASLARGLVIAGERFKPVAATLDRQQGDNAWLTMALSEGRNREIRRLAEHFGWQVNRLIRIAYGPFQLGHLAKDEVEEVTGKVLKEQLGIAQPSRRDKDRAKPHAHNRRPT